MYVKYSLQIVSVYLLLAACNTNTQLIKPEQPPASPTADKRHSEAIITKKITPKDDVRITKVAPDKTNPKIEQIESVPNYQDIWLRIKDNLSLDRHLNQPSVQDKLAWYKRNQDYLDRVADRANPYLYFIVEEIEKRGLPMELALLPIVESAYHPFAYSPSKASGIWQFIPGTGKQYGLKQNWWYDGRRDIVAATHAALDYLEKLQREFKGDWLHALAAYNTGERNVARSIKRNKNQGKKQDFWSLRLPRETRGYVPSLLAVAELVANPTGNNVNWKPINNQPYFAEIDVGEQLDIAVATTLAEMDIDSFYTLNPGFNRWATDPDGPHKLLVPVDKQQSFEEKLANLPEADRVRWKRHIIRRGESLSVIADRYRTSVATLKKANGLRNNLIRTGHSLLIPSSKQPLEFYTLSLDSRRYRGLKRDGNGQKYLYTVRRGDTLWDIGRQYGVSIAQLTRWNGISSRNYLQPGQKLSLWFDENKGKVQNASLKVDRDTPITINYTVKKGDSLWLISRRFGTTVAQLLKWNNLNKDSYLQPGQKLILISSELSGA